MSIYTVIDVETTGFDPAKEHIIEIAAVRIADGIIGEEFSSLVNCGCPIPPPITRLTGIDDAMLAPAPGFPAISDALREFIGDSVIIAHNAPFDKGFVDRVLKLPNKWLDTVALARLIYPTASSYSLGNLIVQIGEENDEAHRALSDARATAMLFNRLCADYLAMDEKLHKTLFALSRKHKDIVSQLLSSLSWQKLNINPDEATAAIYIPMSHNTNALMNKNQAVEYDEDYRIPVREIYDILGAGGRAEAVIEGFEERAQQLEMCERVAETINNKEILLAEAGTGTGKSLAYLVPAALYAANSGNSVIVSTYTLTLQNQLIEKDIPVLQRLLGKPVRAAVLKGRSNYICLRAYENLLANATSGDTYFLLRMAVWLAHSADGDGSALLFSNEDRWKWQTLSAVKENCAAPFCRHCSGKCFVYNNRRNAELSELIIVNHSLLISGASVEGSFFSENRYLIIDEAHHLEKAAESQLTATVNYYQISSVLSRLKRSGRAMNAVGRLESNLHLLLNGGEDAAFFEDKLNLIDGTAGDVLYTAEIFFVLVREAFALAAVSSGFYPAKLRITDEMKNGSAWAALLESGSSFAAVCHALYREMLNLLENIELLEEQVGKEITGKDELRNIGIACRETASTLQRILAAAREGKDPFADTQAPDEKDLNNFVTWVQFEDAKKLPSLHMTPVDLSEPLKELLFDTRDSVILTSATLTAGDSFNHFKDNIGLTLFEENPEENSEKAVEEMIQHSPFYYSDQALFLICDDLPDPAAGNDAVFVGEVAGLLKEIISVAQGRSLVLFTSHYQLKSVYEQIASPLGKEGITVLAHGISGNRNSILERFRKEKRVCILGANTFWEGIDVIGEALSMVVIVKLPFWPPTTPTVAARAEKIEVLGGNSFMEYSLPEALIRFKQGFGRLIRSSEDQGVFCVLDRRIFEKRYGEHFINALPQMTVKKAGRGEIKQLIESWLP